MSIAVAFRRYLRPVLAPALGIFMVGYFAYHAVQGEHGLIAYGRLQGEIAEAEATLSELRSQRAYLEHRADLLSPRHLDRDMLEERLRFVLNYAHPDEVILYTAPTARRP
jgi:cell division protein FtsB